ncbi:MAG: hypothetical protein HKN76_11930 [Saprospiraceae bacterium]|nr:hypothetical protein [Saprospiraceae bacterium]
MKRLTLFASLLLGCLSSLCGQSEMNLIALKSVMQSDAYNPALFREQGLHFGLPSGAYNFFHTGPALEDLVNNTTQGSSLDISNLANELSGDNYLTSEFRFQTFKIKLNRPFWSIGFEQSINFNSNVTYPDDLILLYKDGNQQFIGQTVMIGPRATIYSYNSYALTLSYQLRGLSIGIRPKLLMGNYYGNTPRSSASLTTSDDIYQLTLDTDFQFDNVGILSFADGNLLNYQVGQLNQWRPFTKNPGGALDLGLDVRLSDRLNFAISGIDIGTIKWKDGIKSYVSNRIIEYDGATVEDIFMIDQLDINGALDSLRSIFDVSESSSEVSLSLPTRWFMMVGYAKDDAWNLALTGQYIKSSPYPVAIALVTSAQVQKWWTLGAAFGYRFGRLNAGLHTVLSFRRWRGFLTIDNVSNGINPLSSKNYQMNLGLSLHFGTSTN